MEPISQEDLSSLLKRQSEDYVVKMLSEVKERVKIRQQNNTMKTFKLSRFLNEKLVKRF